MLSMLALLAYSLILLFGMIIIVAARRGPATEFDRLANSTALMVNTTST